MLDSALGPRADNVGRKGEYVEKGRALSAVNLWSMILSYQMFEQTSFPTERNTR